MVETVLKRLEAITGRSSLSVVDLRELLGVTYQAAAKVYKGGGIALDTANNVAKKIPGLNPAWLMSGEGDRYLPKAPPAPSSPGADAFSAPTPEELALLKDFRALLDVDREHYRQEIAAKAGQMNEHWRKLLGDLKGKEKP